MVRSSGFGSITNDKRPIQTRFRYGSDSLLNLPLPISRRLILQQARSQTLSRPPTACKLTVSCSISLPSRGSFHLSLAVLFTIGHSGIFSLTRWSSQIHTGFHVLHATRDTVSIVDFRLQDFHFLWYSFPAISPNQSILVFNCICPTTLNHKLGLGCSRFARRYSGNRFYFLFLQVLRCFSSLGLLFLTYIFNKKF